VAFLYDLLGASQEHKIKPKSCANRYRRSDHWSHQRAGISQAAIQRVHGSATGPDGKVDVPYVTRLSDELKIYKKDYHPGRVKGCHIAPHVLDVAAMWAVLTVWKSQRSTT